MTSISKLSRQAAATVLSLTLLCASGTPAWSQAAISGAAVQAPVGGQFAPIGVSGVTVARSGDIQLANLPLALSGTLGAPSALPTPDLSQTATMNPGVQLGRAVSAAPQTSEAALPRDTARSAAPAASSYKGEVPAAVKSAASRNELPFQAVERHPVVEILNAVNKAGATLPQSLSTPEDFAKLQAAAEALPAGRARDNLVAFAHAMSLPDASRKAGELDKLYDNASLMPSAEPAKAEGFWAKVAGSRLAPSGLKKYAAAKAEAQRRKAATIDTSKLLVPAERLRWVPETDKLPESTRFLKPNPDGVVGQGRALKAIEFGAKMPGKGYNIIVAGEDGSGRELAVRSVVTKVAASMPNPGDLVQVHDFDEGGLGFLQVAPGAGKTFAAAVDSVLETMMTVFPKALNGDEFQASVKEMQAELQKQAQEKQKALDEETAKVRIRGEFGLKVEIRQTGENTVGIAAVITKDGQPVKPEEIDKLIEGKGYTKDELLADMQAAAQPVIQKYAALLQENEQAAEAIQEQVQQMAGQVAMQVLQQAAAPLLQVASGQDQDNPVMKALREKLEKRQAEFEAEVAKVQVGPFGLFMSPTPEGLQVALTFQGIPVSPEVFEQLKQAGAVDKDATFEGFMQQAAAAVKPLVGKLKEMLAANKKDMAEAKRSMPKPTEKQMKAIAWAKAFLQHVGKNAPLFLAQGQKGVPDAKEMYGVSVQVDNSATKGAPVIFEKNPSKLLTELTIGKSVPGGAKLELGSYNKAHGGFLVLDLMDVLRAGAYQPLAHMMRTGKTLMIKRKADGRAIGIVELDLPSDVKVVLIASPMLRMMLESYDEDFPGLFKAVAEFEHSLEIAADNIAYYLRFIRNTIETSADQVMDMNREALGAVLEYAAKLAESNQKLTARLGPVLDLMREATYWAKQAGRDTATREDVDRALEERADRESGMKRRMHELYSQDIFTIQVEGQAVGQINGLAVMGDFGVPARITVRTVAGSGVFSADKDAGTTGPSFNKALAILEGFLKGIFGKDKPMPAQLRISFEQNYGGIDGDSATQTQIYAALSSMSGLPIKQGIAITGSADQYGNVQAIGGVNHKIEGYYDVVKEKLRREGKEMTGEQGVIIPTSNVGDLMLRPDIVEAVKAGKFHIWAVSHVGQGVEILTGQAYSEVLLKAQQNIGKMKQ